MSALLFFSSSYRKRRGAINAKQLHFLERYKPRLRMKAKNGSKGESCSLM